MSGLVWPAVLVASTWVCAVLLARWSYTAGVAEGARRTALDGPSNPDLEVMQLGSAILDLAGQGAEEIRLVLDDTCGAWVATGTRRTTGGDQ